MAHVILIRNILHFMHFFWFTFNCVNMCLFPVSTRWKRITYYRVKLHEIRRYKSDVWCAYKIILLFFFAIILIEVHSRDFYFILMFCILRFDLLLAECFIQKIVRIYLRAKQPGHIYCQYTDCDIHRLRLISLTLGMRRSVLVLFFSHG